jgi:hypothetical protein
MMSRHLYQKQLSRRKQLFTLLGRIPNPPALTTPSSQGTCNRPTAVSSKELVTASISAEVDPAVRTPLATQSLKASNSRATVHNNQLVASEISSNPSRGNGVSLTRPNIQETTIISSLIKVERQPTSSVSGSSSAANTRPNSFTPLQKNASRIAAPLRPTNGKVVHTSSTEDVYLQPMTVVRPSTLRVKELIVVLHLMVNNRYVNLLVT